MVKPPLRVRFLRWLMRGVASDVIVEAPVRPVRRVSDAALAMASVTGDRVAIGADIFARPRPIKGTIPATVTMDSAGCPSVEGYGAVQRFALQNLYHEGLAFLGYQRLAELAQRVEYRHISAIWAEHATRKPPELKGPKGKEQKLKELNDFLGPGEGNLNAVANLGDAAYKEGLFGRCHLFLDCDDSDDPAELTTPLIRVKEKVSKAHPLKRLKLIEPMWCYPGPYNSTNPRAPDFYKPTAWYMMGDTIDDSRLLTFVGNEMPDLLKPAYAFGGMSRTQECKPYVDNWLRNRQSGADLLNSFSLIVLKTDLSSAMGTGGGEELFARIDFQNRTRTNRGMHVADTSEELESLAVPLSNVPEMVDQSQDQVASAARIPASIYLQKSPTGLNANSEGEERSFAANVNAYQERVFRPNFQVLLELAQLSLYDEIDPEITFIFPPLLDMDAKELAEIQKLEAETDNIYVAGGIVSNEEARDRIQQDEESLYHGVDLSGEAPELPDAAGENDNEGDTEPLAAE